MRKEDSEKIMELVERFRAAHRRTVNLRESFMKADEAERAAAAELEKAIHGPVSEIN